MTHLCLYLVLAICVALPYKVQRWTSGRASDRKDCHSIYRAFHSDAQKRTVKSLSIDIFLLHILKQLAT